MLVRAALAHVQFETIHPFLDGNGRVGRLLIALLLADTGTLKQPLLYLSLYFKRHRSTYYELLDEMRTTGNWERWLLFFLEGVRETSQGAVDTCARLVAQFDKDRIRIAGGRGAGAALRVHAHFQSRPVLSIREASRATGLSYPGAAGGMSRLMDYGIVREITGRRRNRFFAYSEYLSLLSEGTEPL